MIPGIHHKGTLGQKLRADHTVPADPAEEGVNPRGQLRRRKGLCDIVIRTGHQAGDLIHLLGPGGEHDNADLLAGGTNPAADFKAIRIRQHNVQDGNADVRILRQTIQRLLTGARFDGIVAGPL